MKKKLYRALALGLCAASFAGVATGCKKGKVDNSEKTVEVFLYNAGYGRKWLDKIVEKFEEKTEYDVVVKEQASSDALESMVKAGGDNTTTDLFIVGELWDRYIQLGEKAVKGYDFCLEALDDLYEEKVPGEEVTIAEKMNQSVYDFQAIEVAIGGEIVEKRFSFPWGAGWGGLIYNKALFTKAGLTHEPRTTDELFEFCETLKGEPNKITPFIYSAGDDYFEYTAEIWWTQYATLKGRDNWHNLKLHDTFMPEPTASMQIFDDEGLYEMLCVFEGLLDPAKGYVDKLVESYEYTTAQAKFFDGQGAIMPNGDWLENEMANAAGGMKVGEIEPMRTPIISALSDKLSYWAEDTNYTQAKATMGAAKKAEYDNKLRALVDYVDGVTTTLPEGTTTGDAEIVRAARRVTYNGANLLNAAIPVYSTAKVGAKELLKYFATDEAIEIYMNNTHGCTFPFEYDYKSWSGYASSSNFTKKALDIKANADYLDFATKYRSVGVGGLGSRAGRFSIWFGAQDNATRKSAAEWIKQIKNQNKNDMANIIASLEP